MLFRSFIEVCDFCAEMFKGPGDHDRRRSSWQLRLAIRQTQKGAVPSDPAGVLTYVLENFNAELSDPGRTLAKKLKVIPDWAALNDQGDRAPGNQTDQTDQGGERLTAGAWSKALKVRSWKRVTLAFNEECILVTTGELLPMRVEWTDIHVAVGANKHRVLTMLEQHGGAVSHADLVEAGIPRKKIRVLVSELRTALKECSGFTGDPFPPEKNGHVTAAFKTFNRSHSLKERGESETVNMLSADKKKEHNKGFSVRNF